MVFAFMFQITNRYFLDMRSILMILSLSLLLACSGNDDQSETKQDPDKKEEKTAKLLELSGKIYSLKDSSLIAGAMVIRTGSVDGTITDHEGSFKFRVPNKDSTNITFAAQGYQTSNLKVSTKKELSIFLEPTNKEE
jgi:hypothetical protein